MFRQAWSIISQAFRAGYEYIGIVMLANVVWFLVTFSPVLIVTLFQLEQVELIALGALGTLILVGPATAAVHFMMNKLVHREETTIADFKEGFLRFFGRSLALTLVNAVILVILVFDLWFSLFNPNPVIRLLTGIWIYFLIFWYVLVQFVFPFLVQQNTGIVTIMKRSALISIDNVGASVLIALVVALVGALSIALAAPMLLFFVCLAALLQNYALVEMMKKYEQGNGTSGR